MYDCLVAALCNCDRHLSGLLELNRVTCAEQTSCLASLMHFIAWNDFPLRNKILKNQLYLKEGGKREGGIVVILYIMKLKVIENYI